MPDGQTGSSSLGSNKTGILSETGPVWAPHFTLRVVWLSLTVSSLIVRRSDHPSCDGVRIRLTGDSNCPGLRFMNDSARFLICWVGISCPFLTSSITFYPIIGWTSISRVISMSIPTLEFVSVVSSPQSNSTEPSYGTLVPPVACKSSSVPLFNNDAMLLIGSSGKSSLTHLFDARDTCASVPHKTWTWCPFHRSWTKHLLPTRPTTFACSREVMWLIYIT